MIGIPKTMRRLASGLAIAALAVAVAAPAGLAGGKPDYGPPDGWAARYLNASDDSMARHFQHEDAVYGQNPSVRYSLPAGFVTDTMSSARAAHSPAVVSTALPKGFVTDTILSARGQQLQVTATASGGFDWGSFGIGIGAGVGALLILGAVVTRLGKLRQLASA